MANAAHRMKTCKCRFSNKKCAWEIRESGRNKAEIKSHKQQNKPKHSTTQRIKKGSENEEIEMNCAQRKNCLLQNVLMQKMPYTKYDIQNKARP